MKFEVIETRDLDNGGAELVVEMDETTKNFLINYAVIDILTKQLDKIEELHNDNSEK